jgi:hypothetical protein
MSVEGATDGAAFETYVEHFLLPTLKKGQIVVMDNLQVHKCLKVRELIEGAGARVLFLTWRSSIMALSYLWSAGPLDLNVGRSLLGAGLPYQHFPIGYRLLAFRVDSSSFRLLSA